MLRANTWLVMLWGYLLFSIIPPIDNILEPVAETMKKSMSTFTRSAVSSFNKSYHKKINTPGPINNNNNNDNIYHTSNIDDVIYDKYGRPIIIR